MRSINKLDLSWLKKKTQTLWAEFSSWKVKAMKPSMISQVKSTRILRGEMKMMVLREVLSPLLEQDTGWAQPGAIPQREDINVLHISSKLHEADGEVKTVIIPQDLYVCLQLNTPVRYMSEHGGLITSLYGIIGSRRCFLRSWSASSLTDAWRRAAAAGTGRAGWLTKTITSSLVSLRAHSPSCPQIPPETKWDYELFLPTTHGGSASASGSDCVFVKHGECAFLRAKHPIT